MLEILQRVHEADAADSPVSPDLPDANAEAEAHHDGELSEQTIARLLEKVGASSKFPHTCDQGTAVLCILSVVAYEAILYMHGC